MKTPQPLTQRTGSRVGRALASACRLRYRPHRFPPIPEFTMGHLIGTLILGLIVGGLARWVTPGEQKLGWILTCVLGVAGSFLASAVGQAAHWYQPGQPAGWLASVLGAVVLLFVVGKVRGGASGGPG
jgi:uncharacterized membrane protein YeaQ/YmgE (transglycosylase-associated protein family)